MPSQSVVKSPCVKPLGHMLAILSGPGVTVAMAAVNKRQVLRRAGLARHCLPAAVQHQCQRRRSLGSNRMGVTPLGQRQANRLESCSGSRATGPRIVGLTWQADRWRPNCSHDQLRQSAEPLSPAVFRPSPTSRRPQRCPLPLIRTPGWRVVARDGGDFEDGPTLADSERFAGAVSSVVERVVETVLVHNHP